MNIYNLFYTILSNNELVEEEINNRTYVLDYSFCQTEKIKLCFPEFKLEKINQ